MRSFNNALRARKKRSSHLALAIALATGTAVTMVGFAEPAHAQRSKKDKKKKETKASYSKEFIAAYQPVEEMMKAETPDLTAVKGQIPGLISLSQSVDEKMVIGNLVYNVGIKSSDRPLQYQGMAMMLESGKVDPTSLGQYNFVAYQLANAQGDYATARGHLQEAMRYNFSTAEVGPATMRVAVAESYFAENRIEEGLADLANAIAERKAAGQAVDEAWYRRGLSVAYKAESPKVFDVFSMWIADYPSETNWRDGINIARNMNTFQAGEMLDLLRLGYQLKIFNTKQEYIDYIEAADPRRLPKEVESVISHGYSTGNVSKDDIYVADSLKIATGRISSDRAELPALERDANASGAGLRTVVAAGDAFLNYGQYSKAEQFYAKSLAMPGVDTATVSTRLGIAQTMLGKYDEAQATFGKINGKRAPIAKLWAAYAASQAGGATASGG